MCTAKPLPLSAFGKQEFMQSIVGRSVSACAPLCCKNMCCASRFWGSPKASHIKASHPHFPHFPRFRVRIFRIFRVFRVFVLRSLLRPLFSWGGRDVRIFRIFAVSGLNRWFRKSDRPALGWPALGDWEFFTGGGDLRAADPSKCPSAREAKC